MKYALITGGTKGIGHAIAEKMLIAGYAVILNYAHDDSTANEVLHTFDGTYPGKVHIIKQPLNQVQTLDFFLTKLSGITEQLDVLVFNYGKTDRTSMDAITFEQWSDVFDSNLNVPFFLMQKLLPALTDGSSILFVGSSMGTYPHSLSLSYGVSKAAVHALVKNAVKFLAPRKIRINAVVPGFVDTEWQQSKPEEVRKRIENKIALGRFASPCEIAEACFFLLQNSYMNGELLHVDGGYSYQ